MTRPARSGSTWLADWGEMLTDYNWELGAGGSVGAGVWVEAYNVTGAGFVAWVAAYFSTLTAANTVPPVRLTIDGNAFIFDGVATGSGYIANVVNGPIPFEASCKIEVQNSHTAAAYPRARYTVLRVDGSPLAGKSALDDAASRNCAYHRTNNTALQTVIDTGAGTAGYLLEIGCELQYSTGHSYGRLDLSIDGTTRITDREVQYSGTGDLHRDRWQGPVRFANRLIVRHRVAAAGPFSLCRVQYTLDA